MTLRYRLRTLLILLAILPPLLAIGWWRYLLWRSGEFELERRRAVAREVDANLRKAATKNQRVPEPAPPPAPVTGPDGGRE